MNKQVIVYMSVAILIFTAISSSLYQPQQSFNAKAEQHNTQLCDGAGTCSSQTTSNGTSTHTVGRTNNFK